MNYAKIIDATIGLFPKKIKVTLIHAGSNQVIGKYSLPAGQLPDSFAKPTELEINNTFWRILKAQPVLADDFLFTKKLALHVRESTAEESRLSLFNEPTISAQPPCLTNDNALMNYSYAFKQQVWRQIEFLPQSVLPIIEEEINTIKLIVENQQDPLHGYSTQYKREKTVTQFVSIPFEEFCKLIDSNEWGSVIIANTGTVENGFSIRSGSRIFYGIKQNNTISTLCIDQFDYIDDEIMQILTNYDVVLIDWCNVCVLGINNDNLITGENDPLLEII